MNKQLKLNADGSVRSYGIEWTHAFGWGSGYTWNWITGCDHGCEWRMSDGSMAVCYAKSVAESLKSDTFFPGGFEPIEFHPERLEEPLKHVGMAGIFAGSMTDVFGRNVPSEWIQAGLDVMARCPQHRFMLLTKNAKRLKQFSFPSNVWVGVSMPPTIMFGKELTADQQYRFLDTALDELAALPNVSVKWMSFEPLSFDISPSLLRMFQQVPREGWLDWAVIGAASNGSKFYQPDPDWTQKALDTLGYMGVPVFFKGNLQWDRWLTQFPVKALQYTHLERTKKLVRDKVTGQEKEVWVTVKTERLPWDGHGSQKTAPRLDFLGQPIPPEYVPEWNPAPEVLEAQDRLTEQAKEARLNWELQHSSGIY